MARERALAYQPGIDGLRALAVAAVVLYHAQQSMPTSWLPGGFLGVEVFFVISGYLITALLITEHEQTGRIGLGGFWVRRARRLLPALVALLAGTIAIVGILGARTESLREHVGPFRGMWLSAWGYATNWYQIAAGLRYGENLGRPPLLRHLWSLAVEEQFYIVWPLVMWAVLVRASKRRAPGRTANLRVTGVVFVALALAIALVTALLYRAEDLTRINTLYLATPTRAGGLLLGAALAIFWQPWNIGIVPARRTRLADAVGLCAAALLLWSFLRWHLTTDGDLGTQGFSLLFRGGFLVVGVATAALIVAATCSGSAVSRALSSRPLVWLGKRSYGLYLWHWPVFQLLRPRGDLSLLDITQPDLDMGWFPALVLRLAVTAVLTELSYRLLEMPIRRHGIVAPLRRLAAGRASGGTTAASATAAVTAVVLTLVAVSTVRTFAAVDELAVAAACNAHPEVCGDPVNDGQDASGSPAVTPAAPIPAAASPNTTPPGRVSTAPAPPSGSTAPTTTQASTTTASRSPLAPLVVGDSVVVGARVLLQRAGLRVDAKTNRGFAAAEALLREYQARGEIGDVVFVALGTSGGIKVDWVDSLMTVLGPVRHVVFITPNTAGRQGGRVSREILLGAARRYPNVSVLDWWEVSAKYRWYSDGNEQVAARDLYFTRDRIHLLAKGRRLFADLIVDEVKRLEP